MSIQFALQTGHLLCGGIHATAIKRLSTIFFICIAVFLSNCGKVSAQAAIEKPEAMADTIVYVTNSGRRYHREDCRSLRNSRIALSLVDAVRSGYNPCSQCNPPGIQREFLEQSQANNNAVRIIYRVHLTKPENSQAVDFSLLLPAEVIRHIDGDTIAVRITNPPAELKAVETIRLIGVDTPETVHSRRAVEELGIEASNFTRERLLGKTVYLAFDWDLRDRYGRVLAYVYTTDRRCHNAELIRQGYGHAYTRYPFRFMQEFRNYEQEAREQKRGLWR